VTVTAIRRVGRAQAIEQLRLDPVLAQSSLSSLAKRWGVSRSTARDWLKRQESEVLAELLAPAPTAKPLPPASAPAANAVLLPPVAVAPERGLANLIAYVTAAALAAVAAYFSVSGMTEIFPGAPDGIVVLGLTMEATKLVAAGWLSRHWRLAGGILRAALITLIALLALINAAGVYGRLVEAHVGVTVSAAASIEERIGSLEARLDAQGRTVAAVDERLGEIDAAIAKLTASGRATAALNAMAAQRKMRETLLSDRAHEAAVLTDLRSERAKLEGERQRAEAARGPVVYMAAMLGISPELAIRWLILLIVLACDPTAIALTVAASKR
jgi:transposase-like protein/uncharacterized coiled-coil protein SlyX